jgi:AMMECR1 domain-containing protein
MKPIIPTLAILAACTTPAFANKQPEKMTHVAVRVEVYNATMQYLQTRPWAEVNQLLGELNKDGVAANEAHKKRSKKK